MKSEHTFRLKFGNSDTSWELDYKKKNYINGKIISQLGMCVPKHEMDKVFFSIEINKNNIATIKNEGRNILFIKKIDSGFERKLYSKKEFTTCDSLTVFTLYFDKNASNFQFFHFVKEIKSTVKGLSEITRTPILGDYDENIIMNISRQRKIIMDEEENCEPNNIQRRKKIIEDDAEDIAVPKLVIKKKKIVDDDEDEKFFHLEDRINELCNKVKSDQLQDEQKKTRESLKKFDNFNEHGKRARPTETKENKAAIDDFISSGKKSLKRLKKNTQNKELILEYNCECPICLEKIVNLANLDSCIHDFCRSCIEKWAKESSTNCPICKRAFTKIIYYEKNKRLEKRVKKKHLDLAEDEFYFEEYEFNLCLICGNDEHPEDLLVCDHCQYNVCHYRCDGLDEIPEGEWYCQLCRRHMLLQGIVGEAPISDDEDDGSYVARVIEDDDSFSEYIDDFEGLRDDLINQVIERINIGTSRRRTNSRRRNIQRRNNR
jgi:hypothetical protein